MNLKASNRPYVSNYAPLEAWLDKHEARPLWQLPLGNPDEPQAYIEGWLINNKIVIVQVFSNKMGWNLFIASDSPEIKATLDEAEKRLGIGLEDGEAKS